MKKWALLLIAALSCLAVNAAGFFRQPDLPLARLEAPDADADVGGVKFVALAATPCAIMLRYQIASPTALEIQYVGGSCADTELAAIVAASLKVPVVAAAKINGEPATTPVYQCSVNITWDPIAATAPSIAGAGTGCENTAGSALAAAAKAVRCEHVPNAPCR